MKGLSKDLMASALSPMVLLILRRKENYGYEIIQQLRNQTNGELEVAEGTLYPVLKKMEEKDWIKSSWKNSESGRERKYYQLTDKGVLELEKQVSQLNFINNIINKLWNTPDLTSKNLLTNL